MVAGGSHQGEGAGRNGGQMDSILDVIVSRRSVRKWRSNAVSDADIKDVLEAAMNAPSAVNEQAWQFVLLSGKVLEDFLKINGNTPKGAPVGILVCGDKKLDKLGGFYLHDCCAATQNILLAVHAKGLGGVWTAVFPNAVPEVHKLLNLPDHVIPISFVPFGYPDVMRPKPSSRYDETKVHRNGW
jgi:nitroreductase